jgi:hypothetical protein
MRVTPGRGPVVALRLVFSVALGRNTSRWCVLLADVPLEARKIEWQCCCKPLIRVDLPTLGMPATKIWNVRPGGSVVVTIELLLVHEVESVVLVGAA